MPQVRKNGELVDGTLDEFTASLRRFAGWCDEKFKYLSDPSADLGWMIVQAADEIDRLKQK